MIPLFSQVSFGIPHYALDEVELQGYTIPKGSIVLSSIYSVVRDPDHFSDPEIFNPERFIDAGTFQSEDLHFSHLHFFSTQFSILLTLFTCRWNFSPMLAKIDTYE